MTDDISQFIGRTEQTLKDLTNSVRELKTSVDNGADKTNTLAIAIGQLPCGERKVIMENLEKTIGGNSSQTKFVWGILALFIVMCITAYSKANSVEEKIEVLREKVITIEKVSYGYNEYMRGGIQK